MSASTWSAALLDEVPAGLEADGDDDEGAEAEGAEAEDDGVEPDGDEADGDEEEPPVTGCPGWRCDGRERGDCGEDGPAVT